MRQGYLGDAEYFINAGKKLLQRSNEYRENSLHTGSLGAITMGLLFGYLGKFSIFIVTFINLSGVAFFVRELLTGITEKYVSIVVILTLISSPIREMLVTGQITGLVMGLISVGSQLTYSSKANWLGIWCFIVAAELKPHFALPLIFLLVAQKQKINFTLFRNFLSVLVVGHIAVNLYLRSFTEIDLVKNILFLTDTSVTTFERSIWTLIDPLIHPFLSFFLKISILIFFGSLTMVLYQKNQILFSSLSFLLMPLSQSYIHLYDFVWMLPFTFLLIFKRKDQHSSMALSLICLLLLPHPFATGLNLIIFISLLFFLFFLVGIMEIKISFRMRVLTSLSSLLLPISYSLRNLTYQESESVFHTLIILLFALPLLNARIESKETSTL
jgi:hypothetical protein